MAEWPDPNAVSVGFAFGSTAYDDPTAVSYETVSPVSATDPGPVQGPITIKRARRGDAGVTAATLIEFALRDDGGEFSPRNVEGPRYGDLRRGTPMQVQVDVGSGAATLARAAVPSWSPLRDGPQINERVPIEALGILARIGRDDVPKSAIRRTIAADEPRLYWSLEDGAAAVSAGATVALGDPATVVGTVEFGPDDTLAGSAGTADITAGAIIVNAPPGGSAVEWHVECWFLAPYYTAGRATHIRTSSPTAVFYVIRPPATAGGTLDVLVESSPGTVTRTIPVTVSGYLDTEWHHVAVAAQQSGADVIVRVYVDGVLGVQDTLTSTEIGRVLYFSANETSAFGVFTGVSHIVIDDGFTPSNAGLAGDGYAGETAADRIDRILDEEGITHSVFATFADTAIMGPQPVGTAYQILREVEAADDGVLSEWRDGQLVYMSTESRYNASGFTITYDAETTSLIPNDDDRDLYNIIEVAQPDGTFVVVEETNGPAGSDETVGVGPRRLPRQTRNLNSAEDIYHHAGWLLRRGTIDQPRYKVVVDFFAQPDLAALAVLPFVEPGMTRLNITGVDADHEGPDDLALMIEGEEIDLDADMFRVTWYCEPYAPYQVGELAASSGTQDDDAARVAEDVDAKTRAALTSSDTAIAFDPNRFRWATLYVNDTFEGRTVAAPNWGTPDVGVDWLTSFTGAGDPSVSGGYGKHTLDTANDSIFVEVTDLDLIDVQVYIRSMSPDAVPAGASAYSGTVVRASSAYILCQVQWIAGGTATLELFDSVGASAEVTLSGVTTSQPVDLLVVVVGPYVMAWCALSSVGIDLAASPTLMLNTTVLTAGSVVIQSAGDAALDVTPPLVMRYGAIEVTSPGCFAGDFPMPIRLGGELVTASQIETTPITFVAAGTAAHGVNASVVPSLPAGHAQDQLLLIHAAIRNSGSGVPQAPAGYTRLEKIFPASSNQQVFAKIHDGSESNPTVTFTGGAAGADTSAQMAAFAGVPITLTDLNDIVIDAVAQLNSSAQNIALPGVAAGGQWGRLILAFGWKQDDWTSVAPPTGFAEIGEPDTTTGSDQGITWAYRIDEAPTAAHATSFVVTGGAGAISRGAMAALVGGYQTATVTRSENGVTKAHAASTPIAVDDRLVLAL